MTPKQKFYKAIYMFSTKSNTKIELCEQIADDFAIGFAHWCESRNDKVFKTYEELLEIYKKTL